MGESLTAYYNEFDPKAAAWLRQLIKNGNITPGEVDERSITEISPDDLMGFDRVHFFAGIGTWDYCLNQAGWGNKPVWTASLPCQPFSAAGKGLGKSDERHLLPHFLELVRQCKPDTIFGEQVERAIAHGWLDDLQTNMEAEGYAVGHCVLGAHSIGASHIRQRLYWVANAISNSNQREIGRVIGKAPTTKISDRQNLISSWESCGTSADVRGVTYPNSIGCHGGSKKAEQKERIGSGINIGGDDDERMALTECEGLERFTRNDNNSDKSGRLYPDQNRSASKTSGIVSLGNSQSERFREERKCRTRSEERECWHIEVDWIYCRDNKYRPVKPGIKPLVDGSTRTMGYSSDTGKSVDEPIEANETQEARVMRLKGYGNAIQAQTAMAFINAYMSI